MTRLAWGLVVALAFVLAVNVLQGRDAESYNRAERERLAFEVAKWQAKYAEAEIARVKAREDALAAKTLSDAAKERSDRLAALVAMAGPSTLAVRTTPEQPPVLVQVPPQVIDKMRADSATIAEQAKTILAQQRALEADSVARVEATRLIQSQKVQIDWQDAALRRRDRKKALLEKAVPVAFLLGAFTGAWIRGQ